MPTQFQKETFKALYAKLKEADTKEKLEELEKQATNHYNLNTITANQLGVIDTKIMEKLAKL